MCYIVAKDRYAHGCYAYGTQHGQHLVELKRELNDAVGLKGVEIMTISRPEAYMEYAPYHRGRAGVYPACKRDAGCIRREGKHRKEWEKCVKRWTEFQQDGLRKRSLKIDMRLQSFFGTMGNTTTKRFPKLLG